MQTPVLMRGAGLQNKHPLTLERAPMLRQVLFAPPSVEVTNYLLLSQVFHLPPALLS